MASEDSSRLVSLPPDPPRVCYTAVIHWCDAVIYTAVIYTAVICYTAVIAMPLLVIAGGFARCSGAHHRGHPDLPEEISQIEEILKHDQHRPLVAGHRPLVAGTHSVARPVSQKAAPVQRNAVPAVALRRPQNAPQNGLLQDRQS